MDKNSSISLASRIKYLTAKHRALDIQIKDSWNSYVKDSIIKKLKFEKAKLKQEIDKIENKR